MSAERVHHAYSPSTLASLESCPCYQPRQTAAADLHERTIAGTRAHTAAETGVDDPLLSDEDAAAVAECLDLVQRRKEALEIQGLNPEELRSIRNTVTELKEAYLPIDEAVWTELCDDKIQQVKHTTAGYVDHVLLCEALQHAELLDWKFGRWSVEAAEKNIQGIAYVLGLFHRYAWLKTITVWFKQPHCDSTTSATFTREQIPALYLRVSVVVARAREARFTKNFSTANPTHPNCMFCANLGKCPAVAKFACEVGHKFHPLKIPANLDPWKVVNGTDAQLGLELAATMKVWSGAFRGQVTDRVIRGVAEIPPGHIISRMSNRKVVDEAKFRAVSLLYVTEEEYNSLKDAPGFGAIEKLISAKTERGQKTEKLEAFAKQLIDTGAVAESIGFPFLKSVDKKGKDEKS